MFEFDDKGEACLNDHEGTPLCLKKNTWEKVIGKEEREHLKYNTERIRECISKPYQIRQSSKDIGTSIIYGKLERYFILPDIEVPGRELYLAVVVRGDRIVTIYPTYKLKEGKLIWPPSEK